MEASPSSSMPGRNYGVFSSFRGVDVRNTFISHLYEKLHDKGIYTFVDSEGLEQGDRRGKLFKAIEGSRMAVVMFSENYYQSKWCLNELAKIMECEKLGTIMVLPVFYKVSSEEVRLHEREEGVERCYQLAMEEMEARHGMKYVETFQTVQFVYSDDPQSQQIMEDLFDVDKLEPAFGERKSNVFNYNEYSKVMVEDKRNREDFISSCILWQTELASETESTQADLSVSECEDYEIADDIGSSFSEDTALAH